MELPGIAELGKISPGAPWIGACPGLMSFRPLQGPQYWVPAQS